VNDDKPLQMTVRGAGRILAALGAVALGLLFAKYRLATLFQSYDDEGYFLTALARYFGPGPLAPGTFSHYGPFYFYLQEMCFGLLRLPVSHDAGRMVTLLFWMGAALLGGAFVFRMSRSLLLGAAAALACVRLAMVLASEPGHPQQVVLFLLTLASCLVLPCFGLSRSSLFLLGAVGAALTFTKINVGAFYLAALGHTLVCLIPRGGLRSTGIGIALGYAVLVPPLLMHAHLGTGAMGYCIVAVLCCGATFACGARCVPEVALGIRRALYALAGTAIGAGAIVLAARWQGVTLAALVQGILLDPAKMPSLLYLGFRVGPVPSLAAAVTIACLVYWCWFPERVAPYRQLCGAARCAAGLGAIFLLVRSDLTWVVPLLPLGVIPTTGRRWSISELFPRLFITDLAATQFLQTYPVAGSQVGIASIPVVLWAFVCIADGIGEVCGKKRHALWDDAFGGLIMLVIAAGIFTSGFRLFGYTDPPANLQGAASLHLPPDQAARYRFLAGSLRANCGVLFTVPRMGSFNFWSSVEAPPGTNAAVSMKSYTPANQAPILGALRSNPRACVLYNPNLLEFWQTTPEDLAQLPLANYILREMPVVVEEGGYQIRTSPNRTSPWVEVPR
jgi:hypothetical protein